jgi:transaldolase / glucose-6-phosphate isomerase
LALKELESLGISISQVTRELESEGVKAFADAFTALLATLEERRAAIRSELGPIQKAAATRVEEFEKIELVRRVYAHDPSLWTLDPKGQEEIRKRMGWLDAVETSVPLIPEISAFVKELPSAFTHAVLLGMGGSSLAPEVIRQICGVGSYDGKPGLDLIILDSTDPVQVKATEDWAPLEKTLYIVSSKSGSTSEVNAFLSYFWSLASLKFGDEAGSHFIAITDPGTSLEKLALERKFRHVFQADANVGGRNSALTAFGLVPAALMGLDVEKLLARTARIVAECAMTVPAGRNPGVVLGAIMGEAALAGKDKVILLADDLWKPLGAWMEQLIAESSGKQGKGILPVDGEPLRKADWYSHDRLFVYLRADGANAALADALRQDGHPVLTLAPLDAYDLGAEFFRWEIATAVACSVIGVNSFDQPDVQDSKDRTGRKVKEFKETRHFTEGEPIWQNDSFLAFGAEFPGIQKTGAVGALVRSFLAQSVSGDYIAINAYVPRNANMLAELQRLRAQIQELTGKPTTLGFGPRFLHSTGQYHKGGPDSGLFLQITAEPALDFDIPGENMSFGTLERAQSLGDLEALSVRGRRALRIHLKMGAILEEILPSA